MTDEMSDDFVDADREYGFEPAVSDNLDPIKSSRAESGSAEYSSAEYSSAASDSAESGSAQRVARPGRQRRGLRRRFAGFVLLAATLGLVGGSYALIAPSSGAADTGSSNADIEAGRQLFNTSCITCHGANLQGVNGRGPTLVGVGGASVYFQVSTGRMPAPNQGANELRKPAKFTEQQTRQLAAFVQSIGGGPQVPPADEKLTTDSSKLADGGELFRLNCASCHGTTGHGAPLSAGKIAPDVMKASDSQIYTAMLSGPENMPVFGDSQITPEQKKEIVSYVQYLQSSKDPGGFGLARIGPVSEGLLIWTAGLGVLILAILWIGAKS
ncbi:MAG: c-type cytochrome [Jatrophihabitantaceae bacterium]